MKELVIILLVLAMAAVCFCGCVTATTHDFDLLMKGNESVGYMRGLSDCSEAKHP